MNRRERKRKELRYLCSSLYQNVYGSLPLSQCSHYSNPLPTLLYFLFFSVSLSISNSVSLSEYRTIYLFCYPSILLFLLIYPSVYLSIKLFLLLYANIRTTTTHRHREEKYPYTVNYLLVSLPLRQPRRKLCRVIFTFK